MSVTTDSVNKATRLNQIGFPEFTAKLITDVFGAIVSANMSQQKAYVEMVKELSKTLTEYVNDAKDSISGTDILNFLTKVAPDLSSRTGTMITETNTGNLTEEQVNTINTAVSIPNTMIETAVATTTKPVKDLYKPIVRAVAERIASERYELLQEMVKQGVVRLVVNSGEIQTSLNFEVRDNTFYEQNSENYNSDEFKFNAQASTGTATAAFLNVSATADYSKMAVSTVNLTNNATSATDIKIAGSVKLNFSTDYQPLNSLTTMQ